MRIRALILLTAIALSAVAMIPGRVAASASGCQGELPAGQSSGICTFNLVGTSLRVDGSACCGNPQSVKVDIVTGAGLVLLSCSRSRIRNGGAVADCSAEQGQHTVVVPPLTPLECRVTTTPAVNNFATWGCFSD